MENRSEVARLRRQIEQTLIPFEQYLASANEPLPNMDFAMETITELKGKLAKLIASNGYGEPIGFDVNEMLIIHTSLVVFSYGLTNIPKSSQKARMSKDCVALCNHFAPMVAISKLQA